MMYFGLTSRVDMKCNTKQENTRKNVCLTVAHKQPRLSKQQLFLVFVNSFVDLHFEYTLITISDSITFVSMGVNRGQQQKRGRVP